MNTPDIVYYGRIMLPTIDTLPFINGSGGHKSAFDNIVLTFDGETGLLKAAEVLE